MSWKNIRKTMLAAGAALMLGTAITHSTFATELPTNDVTPPYGRISIADSSMVDDVNYVNRTNITVNVYAKDDKCAADGIMYYISTEEIKDTESIDDGWIQYEEGATHEIEITPGTTNTIYAVFKDNVGNTSLIYKGGNAKYTVKYDANDGTNAPSDGTAYFGMPFVVSSKEPRREGYFFKGWSTLQNATSATYKAEDKIPANLFSGSNKEITLYAVWTDTMPILADVVEIGDLVNYPVAYDNVVSFTNANTGATSTSEYEGWRVLSIEDDGTVNLISAGIPMTYHHTYGYSEASEKNLTDNFLTTEFTTDSGNTYRKNGFNPNMSLTQVFTNKYTNTKEDGITPNVRSVMQEDIFKVKEDMLGQSGVTSLVVGEYLNDVKFQNMFKTGGLFWLASAYSENALWHVLSGGGVNYSNGRAMGIRPVVSLKPTVVATSKDVVGAWNIDAEEVEGVIRIFEKPTVSGTVAFTGEEQTVSIENFNENVMLLEGEASATNAGTYTATVRLKNPANYTWADGTTDPVEVEWTIVPASLIDVVEVGDYVGYNPIAGTYVTKEANTGSAPVGLTTEGVNWRVFDIDEEAGTIILATEGAVHNGKIALYGTRGYFEGPGELHTISQELYSNSELGIVARSMTKEDLVAAINYTVTAEMENVAYYPYGTSVSGITDDGYIKREHSYTAMTFYNYDTGGEYGGTDGYGHQYRIATANSPVKVSESCFAFNPYEVDRTIGNILGDNVGWLASNAIENPSVTMNYVTYDVCYTSGYGYNSKGMCYSRGDEAGASCGLRPVIVLNLNHKASSVDENGEFNIIYEGGEVVRTGETKPTVAGSYIFTGEEHTVQLNNFDKSTMEISGIDKATKAGTYKVTVSLKDTTNTAWTDGTTAPVDISWTIMPANIGPSVVVTGDAVWGSVLVANTAVSPADAKLSYQWYSGDTASTENGTPIEGATNATYTIDSSLVGKYVYVVVTAEKENYATKVFSDVIEVAVDRKAVAKPTVKENYIYTGEAITFIPEGFDGDAMTITGNVQTEAGSYKATVELSDTSLYVWEDGKTDAIELDWEIFGELAVGDYVNYKPTAGTYETNSANTGAASVTLTTDENAKWRVLDIDEETGKITLTTEGVTHANGITLYGSPAYFEGASELNTISEKLYSNDELGVTARSMTINDLNIALNVTDISLVADRLSSEYATYGSKYAFYPWGSTISAGTVNGYTKAVHGYYADMFYTTDAGGVDGGTDAYGYTYKTPTADNPVLLTVTDYSYNPGAIDETIGNILGTENGWLASSTIGAACLENSWGVHHKVMYVDNDKMQSSFRVGSAGNMESDSFGLRPVVVLTSNVEFVERDENGAWNIAKAITKVEKPTVSGDYIYSGAEQTVELKGFDENFMAITGTTVASEVGTYKVIVRLVDPTKYTWADGTTEPIELTWTIAKSNIKVGDYVNYVPTAGTYTTNSANTGRPSVELKTDENVKWRVLDIDEETGKVVLATEGTTNSGEISLSGEQGLIKGPTELHNISAALYSNNELGLTAESMTLEIIDKATGYVPDENVDKLAYYPIGTTGLTGETDDGYKKVAHETMGTNVDWSEPRFYIWDDGGSVNYDENGIEYRVPTSDNPVKVTTTRHNYDPSSSEYNTNVSEILGVNNGWLATPVVLNSTEYYRAGFRMSTARNTLISAEKYLRGSAGYATSSSNDYGLRPIIILDSKYEFTEKDANGAWNIEVKKVEKPTVSGEYIFNGARQTVELDGFDENFMAITGTTIASEVGTYTIKVRLLDPTKYTWADGTTESFELTWRIEEDVLKVGDYVNYPVSYENVVTYTYDHGGKAISEYEGWRVIGIGDDGTVNLVSAGVPMTYYHITGTSEESVQNLTTNFLATGFTEEGNGYRLSGFGEDLELSEVFANKYTLVANDGTTPVVRALVKEDILPIIKANDLTIDERLNATEYNNLFANGGVFYIGSKYDDNVLYHIYGDGYVHHYGNQELGIRPVVTLKPEVVFTGRDASGAWNLYLPEANVFVKPTVASGAYVFTGSEHEVKLNYFDSEIMTITGDTKATNAGTYTIEITLNDTSKHTWSDGTVTPVTLTWTIEEAKIGPSVRISGNMEWGSTLSADTAVSPGDATLTYQWYWSETASTENGTAIEGATKATYTIDSSLIGKYIYVVVTAEKENYKTEVFSYVTETAVERMKVAKPSVTGVYVYNGEEIEATLVGFDSSKMIVDGNIATEDGEYTATVELANTSLYVWEDGTEETVELDWEVLSNEIQIGDYVNYPVEYENLEVINASGTSYVSPLEGWRILSIEDDGTVNLISAGVPLTYYHEHEQGYSKISVENLTTNFLTTEFTSDSGNTYRESGFEEEMALTQVFTNKYTSVKDDGITPNVRSITQEDIFSVKEDVLGEIGVTELIEGEFLDDALYEYLFEINNWYWIASEHSEKYLWAVNQSGGVGNAANLSLGIRPVVSLKPQVIFTGRDENGAWNISLNETVVSVPTVSGTYTYNGSEHTLALDNFNEELMTVEGTMSATNAGTYQVTVSLKDTDSYVWADRTTTPKPINWTVQKAEIGLTVNIAGNNDFAQCLTAEVSVSPADIEPKFQWYYNDENTTAGGTPIDGATGATYTITEDMIGNYIYVTVTAEKENYVTKVESDVTDDENNGNSTVRMPLTIPTASTTTYEFTGDEITLNLNEFNENIMNIENNIATAIGNHIATITIKDTTLYEWNNGTTGQIEIPWKITGLKIGDYINYPVEYENPEVYAYSNWEAYADSYAKLNGWRVLSTNKETGEVTLISAGVPLGFYFGEVDAAPIANKLKSTTEFLKIGFASRKIGYFDVNGFTKYNSLIDAFTNKYTKINDGIPEVRAMTKSDADMLYQYYNNTNEVLAYGTVLSDDKYEDMLHIPSGSSCPYYLATVGSVYNSLCYIDDRLYGPGGAHMHGIRPVVSLKSEILFTGKDENGAWNIDINI